MKIIGLLTLLIASILFSGCGGGSSDSSTTSVHMKSASSLTTQDFSDTSTELNKTEFEDRLNRVGSFFNYSLASDSAESRCVNEILEPLMKVEDAEDGSYYVDIKEADVSRCYSDYKTSYISYYITNIDKKYPANELLSRNKLTTMRIYIRMEGQLNTSDYTVVMNSALTDANDYDLPCQSTNPIECKIMTVSVIDSVQNNFHYVMTTNLVTNASYVDVNDTYFSSGHIDFEINNWNGTMTYTDKNTAPTYNASSLMETSNGSFSYIE